jgi:predicted RNase H-like HicB family nuclease
MTTRLQITIQLEAAVRHDAVAGVHVGFCPALRLYSQGTTEQEAFEAIKSAAALFVTTCVRRNQLSNVLDSYGFKLAEGGFPIEGLMQQFITVRKAYEKVLAFDVSLPMAA